MEEIEFYEEMFNPLYFELLKWIDDASIRTIVILGSKGSSKSMSVSQALKREAVCNASSSRAYRKESTTVRGTLKETLKKAQELMGLDDAFLNLDFEFRCTLNNSKITMSGLDKEDKIKGSENIKYFYFDELDQFLKKEWDQANLSLRGSEGQKRIATLNPVSKESWVYKDYLYNEDNPMGWKDIDHTLPDPNSFVKISEDGKTILCKTTYLDNYWIVGRPGGLNDLSDGFIDENLIAEYKALEYSDPMSYMVNVLGEWGYIKNDDPFFYNYKPSKHFSKNTYELDPNEETWFSFDFNYNPCVCTLYQVRDNGIIALREWSVKGGTEVLCQTIMNDLEVQSVPSFLWNITGDNSGTNHSAVAGQVHNFDIIKEVMKVNDHQFKHVHGKNRQHAYSRGLCDQFLYRIGDRFLIDNQCKILNKDMTIAKPTTNGKGKVELYKNRDQGYAMDMLDTFRYFINAKFPNGLEDIKRYVELLNI